MRPPRHCMRCAVPSWRDTCPCACCCTALQRRAPPRWRGAMFPPVLPCLADGSTLGALGPDRGQAPRHLHPALLCASLFVLALRRWLPRGQDVQPPRHARRSPALAGVWACVWAHPSPPGPHPSGGTTGHARPPLGWTPLQQARSLFKCPVGTFTAMAPCSAPRRCRPTGARVARVRRAARLPWRSTRPATVLPAHAVGAAGQAGPRTLSRAPV
jgi:hypothetical protein